MRLPVRLRVAVGIVAVAVASTAVAGPRQLRLPELERLLEKERDRVGSECFPFVFPVAVSGRHALLSTGLKCRETGDRDQGVWVTKKRQQAVVDWKRMRLVGTEVEDTATTTILTLSEIEEGPAVLLATEGQLVLRVVGGDELKEYRWKCPGADCPLVLQARVIGGERFPREPLRIAAVGRDDYLVHVFDLHGAKDEKRIGWVHEVDQLVPLASWKQEFRKATALDEELRRVYLNANFLTRFASMIPIVGRELGELLEEAAARMTDNAASGMSLLSTRDHGLFLATQQPFSLTWVDPASGKFSVRPMSVFGEHIRPVSLTGNLSLLAIFPETSKVVRLLVKGTLCEGRRQYDTRDPSRSCPEILPGPGDGEEVCCYPLAALVKLDLASDETDWDLWEEQERGEAVSRLVVEVGKTGATCLAASQVRNPGTIALEDCPGR